MFGIIKDLNCILGIYAAVLTIIGTFGNLWSLAGIIRSSYKIRQSTFIFLGFIRIADVISLYEWNLKNFLQPFFNINLEYKSLWLCKAYLYTQFTSLKLSSLFLVIMITERYLNIKYTIWIQNHLTRKSTVVLSIMLIIYVLLMDSPLIYFNGYIESLNGTSHIKCYDSKQGEIFPLWKQMHSLIYSFIPCLYLILLLPLIIIAYKSNIILIVKKLYNRESNSLIIRIMVMSVFFIILTLPSSICGYFYEILHSSNLGKKTLLWTDSLLFTYHAFNFIFFTFYKDYLDDE